VYNAKPAAHVELSREKKGGHHVQEIGFAGIAGWRIHRSLQPGFRFG
jgi:hypothetical protein